MQHPELEKWTRRTFPPFKHLSDCALILMQNLWRRFVGGVNYYDYRDPGRWRRTLCQRMEGCRESGLIITRNGDEQGTPLILLRKIFNDKRWTLPLQISFES
jgi:hypothetical protein